MKVFSFIKFDTQHATQIHIIWVWNFQLSRQIVFRKRFWKIFFLYIFPCKLLSSFPLDVVIHPIATQRKKTWIYTTWGCFDTSVSFSRFLRRFVKIFFCIYFHVNVCPSSLCTLWPHPTPRIMIWRNLNLPFLKMLRHKFQLLSTLVSEKKIFEIFFLAYSYIKMQPPSGPTLPLGIHPNRGCLHTSLINFWEEDV